MDSTDFPPPALVNFQFSNPHHTNQGVPPVTTSDYIWVDPDMLLERVQDTFQ